MTKLFIHSNACNAKLLKKLDIKKNVHAAFSTE